MINDNKNEVENSPVVNSPPVNSPDQIRPNLTLNETLTLTQVGIHPGGGRGWPWGDFPVTIKSTDHRPTDYFPLTHRHTDLSSSFWLKQKTRF